MVRILASADLHGEENDPYFQQVLLDMGNIALARGIQHIVLAGDIFHQKLNTNRVASDLLVNTYQTLLYLQTQGLQVIILPGNHDKPFEHDPQWTVLSLFSKVATVVNEPRLINEPDCLLCLLPWYPPKPYREMLNALSNYALDYQKPRLLISHVSLAEGSVSPSNRKVEQPTRIADLHPEVWTAGIWLGDYHAHQRLSQQVVYFGAPRPLTFGDFNNVGVWELSVYGGKVESTCIPLPSRYPDFVSHRVDSLSDLPLVNYDHRNRNRIFSPVELMAHLANLYPDAKLLPLEGSNPEVKSGRLEKTEGLTPFEIAERWREKKGLKVDPYRTEIKRFLTGGPING